MNYLALGALYHYKGISGKHQAKCVSLYSALRSTVLRTVLSNMQQTGQLWEQYDDAEGKGIRGHPFSGWTSLVTNIMSEKY